MNTLVASDLDRTLIYSANAMALGSQSPPVRCVELYKGNEQSFSTVRSLEVLRQLRIDAEFVPVTTRTPEQYRRVTLFDTHSSFAICSNGGDLLLDGEVDLDWQAHVRKQIAAESGPLDEVIEYFERTLGPREDAVMVRRAADLFAYAVFFGTAVDHGWVTELADWASKRGYAVSAQGRKVYCVPISLQKSKAVEEVRRRRGLEHVIAAGDSILDADMLQYADIGIRPAHGELHDVDWKSPNVQVTGHAGTMAGEEIALWFAHQVERLSN